MPDQGEVLIKPLPSESLGVEGTEANWVFLIQEGGYISLRFHRSIPWTGVLAPFGKGRAKAR